jgi:hypothetical protein
MTMRGRLCCSPSPGKGCCRVSTVFSRGSVFPWVLLPSSGDLTSSTIKEALVDDLPCSSSVLCKPCCLNLSFFSEGPSGGHLSLSQEDPSVICQSQ